MTTWQIKAYLKYSLGKLESGYHIVDLDYKVFASCYKLPKKEDHRDQFDRLLIWQAIQSGYTLITKDSKIEQYIPDGLKVKIGT